MFFRLLLTALLITSCSTPNWYKPYGYMTFKRMPKGGSPGVQLGWIHGCQSGLGSQFGGGLFMYFYTWSRDPDITSVNPDINKIRRRYKKELVGVDWNNRDNINKNFGDYNTIFWNAHSFCHASILGVLQMAEMRPSLPGDDRYDPGYEPFGKVWSLHGKGDTRIGKSGLW